MDLTNKVANSYQGEIAQLLFAVAPFAGAWIEIDAYASDVVRSVIVAPFAGAWIEIWIVANQI